MLYEIINPSDKMTMEAADQGVAACAVSLLGDGLYGLDPHTENENDEIPIMFDDKWFENKFGIIASDYMKLHWDEVCDALDSVTYGDFNSYQEFHNIMDKLPKNKRDDFSFKWADDRRTSMNNIGERAKSLSNFLRKRSPLDTLWEIKD